MPTSNMPPSHPTTWPAVERLLTLLTSDRPRILVALAGLPGAGKTTVAARWACAVNRLAGAGSMQVLGMDGFHLPRAALARMPNPAAALARRGALEPGHRPVSGRSMLAASFAASPLKGIRCICFCSATPAAPTAAT
jgi:pantothenate kinase-related protein Tda10